MFSFGVAHLYTFHRYVRCCLWVTQVFIHCKFCNISSKFLLVGGVMIYPFIYFQVSVSLSDSPKYRNIEMQSSNQPNVVCKKQSFPSFFCSLPHPRAVVALAAKFPTHNSYFSNDRILQKFNFHWKVYTANQPQRKAHHERLRHGFFPDGFCSRMMWSGGGGGGGEGVERCKNHSSYRSLDLFPCPLFLLLLLWYKNVPLTTLKNELQVQFSFK